MRINPILASLGSSPMVELQNRARALRAAGVDLIDFSIGDPREPTPPQVREALQEGVPKVSQYPLTAGLPELRPAIAGYVRRRFGRDIDPDTQVLPTAGAKEAIFSTPLAFVDRDGPSTVVYPTPGYATYERGTKLAGAEAYEVRLSGDFRFRAGQVPDEVWDRAAMVWINSPHNPSGAVSDAEDLREFVERARSSGTILCADDCYADVYESTPPTSVLDLVEDDLAGVLSYLSLSKRSGMTGYRAAAIVGDAEAIAVLRDLRSATGTASPEFVQRAAIVAWNDDAHVAERREVFAAKRALLRRPFERHGFPVVASEAGLYLWVAVGDDADVAARLLERHVVVSPGRAFGPGGEGHLRLALVPTLDECERAVEVLDECLTQR